MRRPLLGLAAAFGLGCLLTDGEAGPREALALLALAGVRPEARERIVLDPPRSGVSPEVARLLADRAPQAIVYVSCDPPTLGRDLSRLAARGYRPDTMHLFDLFPDTFHMETVVRLRPS